MSVQDLPSNAWSIMSMPPEVAADPRERALWQLRFGQGWRPKKHHTGVVYRGRTVLERHRDWHRCHGDQLAPHLELGLSAPVEGGEAAILAAVSENAAVLRALLEQLVIYRAELLFGGRRDLLERRAALERERDWLAHQLRCVRCGVAPLAAAPPPHPRANMPRTFPAPPERDPLRPQGDLIAQLKHARENAARSARRRWRRGGHAT